MPSLRMTPARIDLLRAVKAGHVKRDVFSPYRHTFRTDKPGYPGVTHAFDLLLGDRLVTVPERKLGDARTVITEVTPAGQAALNAWEPAP